MDIKRVFLIVLDSCGIGEMADAADYGDEGSNTMKAISTSPEFDINTLREMGLFNIDGIDYIDSVAAPTAAVCRMRERSKGKDTTIGHWEICGIVSKSPLPTYPNGFPQDILDKFSAATGRGVLCNKPYSGTDVIRDYGKQHVETGDLIVYTSADSVFQIAAHEDVVPIDELYRYCDIARKILVGEHGVGRVIARPFVGEYPNYTRTTNRHDFSIEPPANTLLDDMKAAGKDVIAVGKIFDIFAGSGVTEKILTKGNTDGMNKSMALADKDFNGLCFINLVDFDMLYGHRNDVTGYARALTEFDKWLKDFLPKLREDDVLMITADHGCDPATPSTDHSREHTPLVIYGKPIKPVNLGTRDSFADIGKTIADIFGVETSISGESFLNEVRA
ncbi:MAG: phosphopentomutase [Acutalibacteraceae bacterium]